MDAALEKRQVKRAYKFYAPAYDFIFDWIFNPGREAAIQLLDIRRGQQVLAYGLSEHYRQIFEITRLADFMQIADA